VFPGWLQTAQNLLPFSLLSRLVRESLLNLVKNLLALKGPSVRQVVRNALDVLNGKHRLGTQRFFFANL